MKNVDGRRCVSPCCAIAAFPEELCLVATDPAFDPVDWPDWGWSSSVAACDAAGIVYRREQDYGAEK